MRTIFATLVLLGASLLAACSPTPPPEVSSVDAPPPPAQPATVSTIEEVWGKIGCVEGDLQGTFGVLNPGTQAPVTKEGTCTPLDGGEVVFFFQLPNASDVDPWLQSGALEIGVTDAVFADGAVVMLASDAATVQWFGEMFTAYTRASP